MSSLALMFVLSCWLSGGKAYGYSLKEQALGYASKVKITGEQYFSRVAGIKAGLASGSESISSVVSGGANRAYCSVTQIPQMIDYTISNVKIRSLNFVSSLVPIKISTAVVQESVMPEIKTTDKKLATANGFTITLEQGIPWISGELNGSLTTVRKKIEGLSGVKSVAALDRHALFLMDDGTVRGLGEAGDGQLGIGEKIERAVTPVKMKLAENVTAVAAGVGHSVFVKEDGTVWAVGLGTSGQTGNDFENKTVPVQVEGIKDIVKIQAGRWHNIALDKYGNIWTWGINGAGQCANGNTRNSAKPGLVKKLSNIKDIACNSCHTLALDDKGQVWSWGFNKYGQVGDNTTKNRLTPQIIKALDGLDVSSIAVGRWHSMVLAKGDVYVWGNNGNGQVGDGTRINCLLPKKVEGLSNITEIWAGECQSFATDKDGKRYGWGKNTNGEIWNGTTEDILTPKILN